MFWAFLRAPRSPTSLWPAAAAAPPGRDGGAGVFPGYFSGGAIDSRGSEPQHRRFLSTHHRRRGGRWGGTTEDYTRHGGPTPAMAAMGAHCCCGVPPGACHRGLGPQLGTHARHGGPLLLLVPSPPRFIPPYTPGKGKLFSPVVPCGLAPHTLGQGGVSQVVCTAGRGSDVHWECARHGGRLT